MWPSSLWRACLTAYAAAVLMKWWGNAWRKSLEASIREREALPEPPINLATLSKANKS